MIDLESTLNQMIEDNMTALKIGNATIYNYGIKYDTANGVRQVFIIERYLDE